MMHRVILLAVVLAATKPTALAQVPLEAPQKVVKVECCPEGTCTASVAVAIQEEKSKKSDKSTKSSGTFKIVRATDDGSGAKVEVLEGGEAMKPLGGVKVEWLDSEAVLKLGKVATQEEKTADGEKASKARRAIKFMRSTDDGSGAKVETMEGAEALKALEGLKLEGLNFEGLKLEELKVADGDKASKARRAIKFMRSTDDGSGAKVESMEGAEALKAIEGLNLESLKFEGFDSGEARILRIDETAIQEEKSKKSDKPKKQAREVRIVRSKEDGSTASIVVESECEAEICETPEGLFVIAADVQEEKGSAPAKKAHRFRVTRPEGAGVFRFQSAPDSEAGTKAERMVYLGSLGDDKVVATKDAPYALRWAGVPPTGGGIVPPLFSMTWSERAEREDEPREAMAFGWSAQSPSACCEAPSLDAIRKVVREELTRALKVAHKDHAGGPSAKPSAKPKSPHPQGVATWLASPKMATAELAKTPLFLSTTQVPSTATLLTDAVIAQKLRQAESAKKPSEADRLRREMKELVKRIANLERALEKLER